ncbi:hypothetical protein IC762_17740 [Bradyrhizobium genosp. L]|uniref:hypothetical protein n=1 Tax=Bradyrhizobium genosp. L TaxID=83637 RepID=UPI0018A2F04A|nr:hypothetical protein [Bradyrhizobium genosp. L]QPF81667.1 hypothetical protein IC762_17740 [Bradyrhizobium genosp. L]
MPYAVVSRLTQGLAIGAHVIRGTNYDRSKERPDYLIYGWALTENIPDAVWESWFEANKSAPFIVNKMVFGSKDLMEARRFAHGRLAGIGLADGAPQGAVKPT